MGVWVSVFREEDGELKFVGDFEKLYRSELDPWEQSAANTSAMSDYLQYSRRRLTGVITKHFSPFNTGLEIGCGHGHVVNLLSRRTCPTCRWSGWDISPAAVIRARAFYPDYTFKICDITDHGNLPKSQEFDVVVLGQMLWYVLHKLDTTIDNCHKLVSSDGLLIISQAFLRTEQRYGKEFADGFHGTLRTLLQRYDHLFKLLEANYDDSEQYLHHDGLFVLRKVSR